MNAYGNGAICRLELHRLQELPADAVTASVLGASEHERLGGMRSPQRQRQYLCGHWLARRMASEHCGGQPVEWQWQSDARGQPSLERADRRVCVSLSHSGDWLACALSETAVGVDVEVRGQRRDWNRLLNYAFPRVMQSALASVPENEQADRFLLSWCMQEARGKRLGDGIQLSVLRSLMPVPCHIECAEVLLWEASETYLALAVGGESALDLHGVAGKPSAWRFEPTS